MRAMKVLVIVIALTVLAAFVNLMMLIGNIRGRAVTFKI